MLSIRIPAGIVARFPFVVQGSSLLSVLKIDIKALKLRLLDREAIIAL